MATHVMTATMPSQVSVYGNPSPSTSGASTPAGNSPTSPRQQYLPLQTRQIRPPKAPLYVPAALRPTERPAKPPTPPHSVHGSLDSLSNSESETGVTRRATMESISSGVSKMAESEWRKNEDLGEVTGLPKRDHWKADSKVEICESPTCRSSFGLFLRRHHCRHCGQVFCSSHTPHMVPLDQMARFHPDGVPSRACDLCWMAYQQWDEKRVDRMNRIQNQIDDDRNSIESDHTSTGSIEAPIPEGRKEPGKPDQPNEIAASIPRGWNWSTF